MSLPEVLLWEKLRHRQPDLPRFRRQHPVGPYILDFYCSAARLAIEIDGEDHNRGDRPERDLARDKYLASLGITVLRYPAADVLRDIDGLAESLYDAARAPPQSSGLGDPLTAPPLHGGAS
jgi:very-short-patch-repair endonuclease